MQLDRALGVRVATGKRDRPSFFGRCSFFLSGPSPKQGHQTFNLPHYEMLTQNVTKVPELKELV